MKYFFLLSILLLSFLLPAQDCNKELLRTKPGTWKAGMQGSVNNVSAADLVKEKGVLNSIHKLLQTNYNPTGCQVLFSTAFGKNPLPGQVFIADPYQYSMYILRYLCDINSADKTKSYIDASTPTTVNITANAIYSIQSLYAANIPPGDFRGYLRLEERPQQKEGAWFLGESIEGDAGRPTEIKEYRWLITYGDTLPFSYMSRKEYLLIQQKRMEKSIKEEGANEYYNRYLKNIVDFLKRSDEELNKPAVCLWNDEQSFTGFVAEGTPGSFIAIKPNPNYYRRNLPLSSPQFFTVVYKVAAGDPVFEENMASIKKAIDFTALRKMLGR